MGTLSSDRAILYSFFEMFFRTLLRSFGLVLCLKCWELLEPPNKDVVGCNNEPASGKDDIQCEGW